MSERMRFGGVEVAQPSEVKFSNEKIWSKNTGRTSGGLMVGDIIAVKKTISLSWFGLSAEEVSVIDSYLSNVGRAFFTITLLNEKFELTTYTVYAGTPAYEVWGWDKNRRLCKGVTVDLIEQ